MVGRRLWDGIKDDSMELFGTFCCCLLESEHFFWCMPKLFLATQSITLILQLVGTFEDHWIHTAECNHMGLQSRCLIPGDSSTNTTEHEQVYKLDNGDDLYRLQITSFSMGVFCLCLAAAAILRLRGLEAESKTANQIFCFSCVLPIISMLSGFLNFVGCMVVTEGDYSLGYSFYLCLASGIVLMTVSCMSIIGYFCMKRNGCDW